MRPCHILRVFTRGDEGGNHLGVVNDLTGLDDEGMQAIATELGFSETIFIDWMEGGIPEVRIFTPALEIPFAGHPLVGAAWTLSSLGPGTVSKMSCAVGEIPYRTEGELTWVGTPLVSEVEPASGAAEIAVAVGLPEPEAAWWAKMPWPYLVMDLGSGDSVSDARPDISAMEEAGAPEIYIVGEEGDHLRVRFFAPGAGVPEDPATGSAASAWAAVRAHEGDESGSVMIYQGDEIGHPSTIHLDWTPHRASLGGTVRRDGVRELES